MLKPTEAILLFDRVARARKVSNATMGDLAVGDARVYEKLKRLAFAEQGQAPARLSVDKYASLLAYIHTQARELNLQDCA